MTDSPTLYSRLGGYDAISAVADNLIPRLMEDELLGRFWAHRSHDSIRREKQLLIDYLCAESGGPMVYTGREMKVSHEGMQICEADWANFVGHLNATFDAFSLPQAERDDVLGFIESKKAEIVEA